MSIDQTDRITAAVAKKKEDIEQRLADGRVTKDKLLELHKNLDMDVEEYVTFQDLKSLACLNGMLTTEEGMTIYNYLGVTPDAFNKQPLEVKVVLTQLFQQLMQHKLRRGR